MKNLVKIADDSICYICLYVWYDYADDLETIICGHEKTEEYPKQPVKECPYYGKKQTVLQKNDKQ